MTTARNLLAAALLLALPAPLFAGDVLQLPTFGFTTVNTTVTVPDGGTAVLGGISRASSGSTTRGVPILGQVPGLGRFFRNRGIGQSMSASTMTVIPRIINLEEEEERQVGRVLAARRGAAAGGPVPPPAYAINDLYRRRAEFLARNVARDEPIDHRFEKPVPQEDPYKELEEIRRQNELAAEKRSREAVHYFEEGQRAEQQGKSGVARVYYRMSASRAQGEFKQEVLARLEAMSRPTADK